jgi:H+/gluconate symporter-like permease
MILLLVIAVVGAHFLGHMTQNPKTKRILVFIFIGAFVTLTGVFGVSVAAPTAAVAVATQKAASVLAAAGVVGLFAILGAEMRTSKKPDAPKPDVWKELEDAEEEWEKK